MNTVTIYSTPSCHFCHLAKDFFNDNNVEFTDYDVATDVEKRNEMLTKSGQMGVPVIVVKTEAGEEELIVGFDEDRLRSLLSIA